MRLAFAAATAIALASCDGADGGTGNVAPVADGQEAHVPEEPAENAAAATPVGAWALQSSGEGAALAYLLADRSVAIRIFCPAGTGRLLVNIPAFRPIGSEERLSFGSGGKAVALVADSKGDAARGGVSGSGDIPDDLAALVSGEMTASYGNQTSGPHPRPAPDVAAAFAKDCSEREPARAPSATAGEPSACATQGTEQLRVTPLRAIGTEPFWAARIEGRCVTYSHPEDQKGTRIWTRYTEGADGGVWAGMLGGQPFRLRAQAEPGCSDGMSDKAYPIAVALTVNGEERSGCAEPL